MIYALRKYVTKLTASIRGRNKADSLYH